MDVVINTAHKKWLGLQQASTQLIFFPRSEVLGQAALTAVSGAPAWVRIADGRSSSWLGEAPFGGQTVLRATTDMVVLQVWADPEVMAAAVGTLFLWRAYDTRISGIDTASHMRMASEAGLFPADESTWVGYAPDGAITGVHSVVRYEGADTLPADEIRHTLAGASNAHEDTQFMPVDAIGLLASRRVRIDPATGRLVID
jgi:hypothetical protein